MLVTDETGSRVLAVFFNLRWPFLRLISDPFWIGVGVGAARQFWLTNEKRRCFPPTLRRSHASFDSQYKEFIP